MTTNPSEPSSAKPPTFIDLFAGCGGLSLGLLDSGWKGLFALERESHAFSTYKHNLIDGSHAHGHDWPEWLEQKNHDVRDVLESHEAELLGLRGAVDLVAGGPPCQGFSLAGRRDANDPRNRLFKEYLRFVGLVQPRLVLVENVRGMAVAHSSGKGATGKSQAYLERLTDGLRELGYHVLPPSVLRASRFGVPQRRPRLFVVAVRATGSAATSLPPLDVAAEEMRAAFLRGKRLPTRRPLTVAEAISDLERGAGRPYDYCDPDSPAGFKAGTLGRAQSAYQRLLRGQRRLGNRVDSHRFANHRPHTAARFATLLRYSRRGVQLSRDELAPYGPTEKHVLVALAPGQVCHTITTLPDDLIHYLEPRILTVREMARLQSFPDWFAFKGQYTTGGNRRKLQAPRYTQVGNAVAPFVAEIIGLILKGYLAALENEARGHSASGSLADAA